jgi:hypothetical protein
MMGVEKRHVARGGKNIIFRRGGGINIVFGPKYRPLGQRVLISCQRVLDNLYRHLQRGCPINKERGNLFAIPLKKPKGKIKIQEATDVS